MKVLNFFLKLFCFLFIYFCVNVSFSKIKEIDKIIAVVNDDIILKSELDSFFNFFKMNNKELIGNNFNKNSLYFKALNKLITDKIILQYAKKIKINFSDKDLDYEFYRIAAEHGFSVDKFEKELILNNINIKEYKNSILNKKIIEELFKNKILPKINISKEEFDSNFVRLNLQINQESYINLSHIYVPLSFNLSNLDFVSIENFVYKILQDARNGFSFFYLKKKYSKFFFLEHEDVGWNKLKELPDIFFHRMKYAKNKEIIGPIISNHGFHILRVNDIKHKSNIHNIVKLKINYIFISYSDILSKKNNYNKIIKILMDIRNKKITFLEALNKYSEDSNFNLGNKKNDWNLINDYHISIRNALKYLKKGDISQPVSFNSGWYLIKIEDKKIFKDMYNFNKEEVLSLLFKKKFNEEIENWIRIKNKNSYIKIFNEDNMNY